MDIAILCMAADITEAITTMKVTKDIGVVIMAAVIMAAVIAVVVAIWAEDSLNNYYGTMTKKSPPI